MIVYIMEKERKTIKCWKNAKVGAHGFKPGTYGKETNASTTQPRSISCNTNGFSNIYKMKTRKI